VIEPANIQKNGFSFFGKFYREKDIQSMNRGELNILIMQMETDIEIAEDKKKRNLGLGRDTDKQEAFLAVAKAFMYRLRMQRESAVEPTDAVIKVLGDDLRVRFLKAFYIAADSILPSDIFYDIHLEAEIIQGELK